MIRQSVVCCLFVCCLFCVLSLGAGVADGGPPEAPQGVTPLANAHAHNDYLHTRPLLDALGQGFTSIEADVLLINGELLVGHSLFEIKRGATLEGLYLKPLLKRTRGNKGWVYRGSRRTVYLLVDIKTGGEKTYAALHTLFEKYREMLSTTVGGKHTRKAVTVVISGNCPRGVIEKQKTRYAAIDGRPRDLGSKAPAHLIPYISSRWGTHFRWRGVGPMPRLEREQLREMVRKAHAGGRRVRFWATPEKRKVWEELRGAKVDLINTDKLTELRRFLLKKPSRGRRATP